MVLQDNVKFPCGYANVISVNSEYLAWLDIGMG